MGNQHIFNRNAYNSMKKRNRDAVMDIKIVMNNGVGYIRKPIPPNTYQIECVRLNETYVGRNHKSLASTRMGRFTIEPECQMEEYNNNHIKSAAKLFPKRTVEGPATNLLYLALCCCKDSGNVRTTDSRLAVANYFDELCPYLEPYICANHSDNKHNLISLRQEKVEEQNCYRIIIEETMSQENRIQDAVLIVHDVPIGK